MPSTDTPASKSLSADQLLEHTLALPAGEREVLLDRILDGIEAERDAEAAEWARRIDDIEAGNYVAFTPEQVQAFMRNRRKGS